MWQSLLSMDAPAVASVAVKALGYLASLTAAGSALFLVTFSMPDAETRKAVRRLGLAGACAAALATLALVPMGAIFLAGGWPGAFDPVLTRMVVHSPIGESLVVRIVGLVLLSFFFVGRRTATPAALLGAVAVCVSFAFRGHVLTEPRLVLGVLLTAHLLGLAFWIGAFAPLFWLARQGDATRAGALADAFGRRAVWVVAVLASAGAGLLVLLTGNPLGALAMPYGQFLVVKVSVFVLLLGLAAINRLRLTPALLAGDSRAGVHLQRSIGCEVAAVCVIALTTAALTTLSSPEALE